MSCVDSCWRGWLVWVPLVSDVEALLAIIGDDEFADSVFDDLFALEQAYVVECTEESTFPEHGKPFAEAAARAIRDKVKAHLDKLDLDAGGSPPAE